MPQSEIVIAGWAPEDDPAIEALHAARFGPGRFARTAFRLREGVPPLPALSFVARVPFGIVGAVTMTRIRIGDTASVLLGPLAVAPGREGRGIGTLLMDAAMRAAHDTGETLVLLVGDAPFYGRFGFREVTPHGRITLPGPVDPARLLIAGLAPGAFEAAEGAVRKAWLP